MFEFKAIYMLLGIAITVAICIIFYKGGELRIFMTKPIYAFEMRDVLILMWVFVLLLRVIK